jgi:hypothetical protein
VTRFITRKLIGETIGKQNHCEKMNQAWRQSAVAHPIRPARRGSKGIIHRKSMAENVSDIPHVTGRPNHAKVRDLGRLFVLFYDLAGCSRPQSGTGDSAWLQEC